MSSTADYDFAVIGGGIYGLALALALRGISGRVALFEAEDEPCTRASRVNQARVHAGFHYPRSFVTAMRSLSLHRRFLNDFSEAVVDDFEMLYAIARHRSKVSAARFQRMFEHLGAPFEPAPRHLAQMFDRRLVEAVFRVREVAFDYRIVRDKLMAQMLEAGVDHHFHSAVERVASHSDHMSLLLSSGTAITASMAFNVTYANLNALLAASGLSSLPLRHEFVEIALVEPPPELKNLAVTVMDGPFFSLMPYPAAEAYSLTHVRYTPHWSWTDFDAPTSYKELPTRSRWIHMKRDAQRYMPCLATISWRQSMFDVKTISIRNEHDDGRPILVHRHADAPNLVSILGGKIDNIYDLFSILPSLDRRLASADFASVLSGRR